MHQDFVCDTSSSEYTEERTETDQGEIKCNKIFLNFNRQFQESAKDNYRIAKVKDLFKYLSERPDIQEMKVSGWLDEGKEEEFRGEDEEEEQKSEGEDDLDSCGEVRSARRGGGQRFAMSRDFWYRKLNTLKAQKLDEAALEAKDIPPGDRHVVKDKKYMKWMEAEQEFSSEVPESRTDVFKEINCFEKRVAKPVEKQLKKGFVNVYDNRKYFKRNCN